MALIQKPFGDIITFTRSSGGGRFNAAGQYEWLGNNAPRFDYDPVTLSPKGLLVEEQRTNTFNIINGRGTLPISPSYNLNIAFQPYTDISPIGLVDATRVSSPSGSSGVFNFNVASAGHLFPIGTVISQSIFVKVLVPGVNFGVYFGNGNSSGGKSVSFTTTNGVIATADSTTVITPVGNSWYRIACTYTSSQNDLPPNFTFTINAGGSLAIWGPQSEVASFATSHMRSVPTFTSRTTTATYFDSNGVMQTAAIGAARTGYAYVNNAWVSQGLLLEGSSTNLLVLSSEFNNVAWEPPANIATVTANTHTAPDGTLSADTLTNPDALGSYRRKKSASITPGTSTYCGSVFVRKDPTATHTFRLNLVLETSGTPIATQVDLVVATGVATRTNGTNLFGVIDCGTYWRLWALVTDTNSGNTMCSMNLWNSVELGTGYSTTVWGAQIEIGAAPSSYIPTTTAQVTRSGDSSSSSQVTRAADVASVNVLSPWYNASEGTLLVQGTSSIASPPPASQVMAAFTGATVDDRLDIIKPANLNQISGASLVGNVVQANIVAGSLGALAPFKAALAFKADNFAVSLNGAAAVTDSVGTVPTVSKFHIGSRFNGGNAVNCHISSIRYFPKRLTNAELQALTA